MILKKLFSCCWYVLKVLPITLACFSFDYILKKNLTKHFTTNVSHQIFFKAVADNFGHGFIASMTWLVVIDYIFSVKSILQLLLCGLIGCFIDVDHFIHARSYNLKDALSLSSRPILHNTTLLVFVSMFLYLLECRTKFVCVHDASLLLFTAVVSHHLRDANRRGLWLWPFGHTRPIKPDLLYVVVLCFIPILILKLQGLKPKREEEFVNGAVFE